MITILSKIFKIKNLHIVGVIKNDAGEIYNLLTIKKRGNKIDVIKTITFLSFNDLLKNIDTKLPIILLIDGKGILNKKIDLKNEVDINWKKNIDYKTIYYTSLKNLNKDFISFCRKNIVDETILKFKTIDIQVLDVYIGSFLSALLNNLLKEENLLSNDLLLKFDNENLVNFSRQSEATKKGQYRIGNDIISSHFLPLYGALIHFFIKPKEVAKTTNQDLNIDEIIYKKAFNVIGFSMLIGFLIMLFTSYLFIQYYGSKNAELNFQNVYSNQSYQLILDLEKQKTNKLNILKESGFLSTKFLTYYGYEIIKDIPEDISLNEVNIIPSNKEVKANLKMNFEYKTIIVKGETFNESSFNNWMEGLKKLNWLQHFEILSLKKDKKDKSQFELKITIKDV